MFGRGYTIHARRMHLLIVGERSIEFWATGSRSCTQFMITCRRLEAAGLLGRMNLCSSPGLGSKQQFINSMDVGIIQWTWELFGVLDSMNMDINRVGRNTSSTGARLLIQNWVDNWRDSPIVSTLCLRISDCISVNVNRSSTQHWLQSYGRW